MIHHFIVDTTSHPAIIAQLASNIAAIIIAHVIVSTFAHTAGHMLFATSFAHRLAAMYIPSMAAASKKIFVFPPAKKYTQVIAISIIAAKISYLRFLFLLKGLSIDKLKVNNIYDFIIYFFLKQRADPY